MEFITIEINGEEFDVDFNGDCSVDEFGNYDTTFLEIASVTDMEGNEQEITEEIIEALCEALED